MRSTAKGHFLAATKSIASVEKTSTRDKLHLNIPMPTRRDLIVAAIVALAASILAFGTYQLYYYFGPHNYEVANAQRLLSPPSERLSSALKYDKKEHRYVFETGNANSDESQKTGPSLMSAKISPNASTGVTLTDSTYKVDLTMKAHLSLAKGKKDKNRIVFPFRDHNGWLVYTAQGTGIKEDIVLSKPTADVKTFSYELVLPDATEARKESDGSIGIYGNQLFMSSITTTTKADQTLLEKAKAKAKKDLLLFTIPAPSVSESDGKPSGVKASFNLEGTKLTVIAKNLAKASYPLTIDPSIYIVSAQQFMAGNNETNVDFDVANKVIKKGATTGARFDQWNDTLALTASKWQQGVAAAGGYIYTAGGIHPSGSVVPFTSSGTTSWSVPAGVTSVTVKAWGAGGGGGGGSTNGDGGPGGGGGFIQSSLSVTPGESLSITVGSAGTGGAFSSGSSGNSSGDGGGGGGYSRVARGGTTLLVAGGGAGGGGGDNSSSTTGGPGGAGGGTSGQTGASSLSANGGGGGSQSTGGSGGTGGGNSGASGSFLQGGAGADGRTNNSTDGSANNNGTPGGGSGGIGDGNGNGYGAGGGAGGGYYGGGGGSGSASGNAGGGGGGGGSSYSSGGGVTSLVGNYATPGNDGDSDRGSAGQGGTGGSGTGGSSTGTAGTSGVLYISYTLSTSATKTVEWAKYSTSDASISSANPGNGSCTGWCSSPSYDLPDPRADFSLVAYNGFLYAIGGNDPSCTSGNGKGDSGYCSTVYIAKIGANGEPQLWSPTSSDESTWTYWYRDADLPQARSGIKLVAYNNRMYLMGGVISTGGSQSVSNKLYVANINPTGQLGTWTAGTNLPQATYGYSAQVYNDRLYLVGGASSIGGAPLNSVYYTRLNSDGTANDWVQTTDLKQGRMATGGDFGAIWGAYLYISGGCLAVNGSGTCTSVANDTQLSSINADGTLDIWNTVGGVNDTRTGHTLVPWRNNLYEVGGCSSVSSGTGTCSAPLDDIKYGTINPDGEASTVADSVTSGTAPCTGGSPEECNLPGPSYVGNVLNGSAILNGYLYIWGGCDNTNSGCGSVSRGVMYTSIGSDGVLTRPASCGSWSVVDSYCYNATSLPSGGVAAPGVSVADGRIYSVGGFTSNNMVGSIYYAAPDPSNGAISSWSSVSLTGIGATSVSYPYSFTRANPSQASTYPHNLYIIGGCTNANGIGCPSGATGYTDAVYKCNLNTAGAPSGCSKTNQLQIGTVPGASSPGLGAMAGTTYANYIYLMGGLTNGLNDLKTTRYAKIDQSNNIVSVNGSGWEESSELTYYGRRRGSGFGYNGYLYVVGGYDGTGGGGVLADIEYAKINVSDGSIEPWKVSTVSIDERWGPSLTVSNSFAYVVGGCVDGLAPTCNAGGQTNSVQTFQVYNNDSGAPANYSTSANAYSDEPHRIGSGVAVLDGKLYVAGGCNSITGSACDSVSDSVESASIDVNGNLGSWTTEDTLPSGRAWGKLKVAGGSLYWLGGQDASGTARNDVYYMTPGSGGGGGSTTPVFRSTTYKLDSTQFSSNNYTLSLNNALQTDYFTMISGGDDTGNTSGPNTSQIRVNGDPFGNFGTNTSSNQIQLTRGTSSQNWVGSVTVVECMTACSTDGFTLRQVKEVTLAAGSSNTLQTATTTLSSAHDSNTVPFGGYLGGGLSTSTSSQNQFSPTAGVRIQKSSTNQLTLERYGGGGQAPGAADVSIFVVEWGSNWNVQEANMSAWAAGGAGVDTTGEYATQSISPVTRDNTWVWKSPGTSTGNGLGGGSFGKVLTLGNGVNQSGTESTVAIGADSASETRRDTVYVMSHSNLANDYRFLSESNYGTSFSQTVDTAAGSETYSSSGGITSSEGTRIPLFYYSDSGNGTAYTRVAGWSNYYTNSTTIQAEKEYSGNNQPGWWESVDFAGIEATSGGSGTWNSASNGLPSARTRIAAAVWNDRIYVVGGKNSSGNSTNTVYVSPQLTGGGDVGSSWSTTSTNFSVARNALSAVAYANNLYIFGGVNDSNDYLSDVQYAQINGSTGTVGTWAYSTSLPKQVVDADAFAANGYIYLLGGRSSTSTCDPVTLVAPVSANTTISSGNLPTGVGAWFETNEQYSGTRYGAASAYYEGKAYVLGGVDCSTTGGTSYTSANTYTYTVPTGVTNLIVKAWGAGGGGGGGSSNGDGGNGGGGGYTQSTLSVTPGENLTVTVGEGGGGGGGNSSGDGGGGGGYTSIYRGGTPLLIASGGGGGGGGDNSSGTPGGQGGAGGGTNGQNGGDSSNGLGGTGATGGTSGSGGNGGNNGQSGSSFTGGNGANGGGGTGGTNNGGNPGNGGDGGSL